MSTKRVVLTAGRNLVRFGKDTGFAELDYIDVRPDTHRYGSENASVTNARMVHYGYNEFADLVGGIDLPDSSVEFTLDVPATGNYRLAIGYANGLTSVATHRLLLNGIQVTAVSYPPTGGWLTGPQQDLFARTANVTVALPAGIQKLRLAKGDCFAELDHLTLIPVP